MGSQNHTTNDRTRTYWTPTMERYFIDLMLEQMHRGNRIGHTFNKQAWADMLVVFNAKFGSQYDKDVLKSRYTNLWKQFNDVKNLLGLNGFSWDETRQMVVADEYVWDAYIKSYPDARSYKTKPVLNFNDLCLIYGYTVADGRYSRSSHDLEFEDEVQGVSTADGMASLASTSSERPRTEWTADMDQYFIELMLDQVGRGNMADNTFNKQAWNDMLSLFNAKFGPQHGKRVLRHRYKKLWKYYSDVTVILKQKGFFWDEAQQMIIANDDVWDPYIRVHPQARAYKMKTLPSYNDLVLIYGDAIDEGSLCNLPQECDISGKNAGERRGSVTPASDRTRTFWTPPMDRYLIDLLLSQVHRGNRIGQTFITPAWIEMVTLFNAKFEAHYDKDVLKNRYKHLRRMYNDLKLLLQQSGFSWDETRDMVTAEDSVWDTYIKAHPDARSYRVKTVPNYHKLCVIFGEETFDGRYNRLAQYIDCNGDTPVLMTGSGDDKNDYFNASIDLGLQWTSPMDRFFIDLLLEQMHGGNKMEDHSFNEQAWVHVVESFNEKFGLQWDKSVLENRYICLVKQHEDISNILNHSGFIWDESKQMVMGDYDVWEGYVKEHPDAISYKDTFLGHYSDLSKILQNEGLVGKSIDQCLGIEIDQIGPELVMDGGTSGDCKFPELGIDGGASGDLQSPAMVMDGGASGDLQSTGVDIQISDQNRKRPAETSDSGQLTKAPKTGQEVQKVLSRMADVVTTLVSTKENKRYLTIENAVDTLQALPDIDDELLLDACDLLEDEKKAKTFLALDVTLRKKWLLRKLRPS